MAMTRVAKEEYSKRSLQGMEPLALPPRGEGGGELEMPEKRVHLNLSYL